MLVDTFSTLSRHLWINSLMRLTWVHQSYLDGMSNISDMSSLGDSHMKSLEILIRKCEINTKLLKETSLGEDTLTNISKNILEVLCFFQWIVSNWYSENYQESVDEVSASYMYQWSIGEVLWNKSHVTWTYISTNTSTKSWPINDRLSINSQLTVDPLLNDSWPVLWPTVNQYMYIGQDFHSKHDSLYLQTYNLKIGYFFFFLIIKAM